MNIYSFGETTTDPVYRFAICTKCKKVQKFEAPDDWRPECCEDAQTATTVDLFKSLGKVPPGRLPPELQAIKDHMVELLRLLEVEEDKSTLENSGKDA